ncbi:MAG: hypothetical protein ACI837_002976 [Crocinitomicaceae bacterium]|jgi:hypothetical protein
MIRTNYLIILAIVSGSFMGFIFPSAPVQTVNPIIGDASLEKMIGSADIDAIDESTRILVHLAYVEKILREKETNHLTENQRKSRKFSLDLLHDYWMEGTFPSNYDYPDQRKPCFRDKDGRICAVGYLVQQTGNEELVKDIEMSQNYAYIKDMTGENLLAWVEQSGLTVEECAMIQPTYGPPPSSDPDYIPKGYAIASSALSGLSLTASAISFSQISRNSNNAWIIPAIGMGSGIAQITLGSIYYGKNYCFGWGCTGNSFVRNDNLSLLNIGLGTFTTAFNTYVFARQLRGRKKNKSLSLNLYSFQTPASELNLGFNLIKRF